MNRKRTKRKLKIGRIVVAFLILITIVVGAVYFISNGSNIGVSKSNMYLASSSSSVEVFIKDEEGKLTSSDNIVRGTKVLSYNKDVTIDDKVYKKIEYDNNVYYVLEDNLVKNERDVVLESVKYVRTSVTVYKNEVDSKIESFIKKGNEIEVIGYDKILDDGQVNMYKIKSDDIEGWVYSKYLADDQESADANYNENGIYDIHKDRKFSRELYGGKASTLDYYPYEKVEFEDNPLLKEAKTMYINAGSVKNIDSYLNIAKENGVNAIVVDIKDGTLAYPSEVAKEYSMTAYEAASGDKTKNNEIDDYKEAINKIKEAGIYAIGRIVVFKDVHYGKDHPEDIIESPELGKNEIWPSVYSRGAWEYNVELAKEAVTMMGFNEIQFDYVRFPESSSRLSTNSKTDFKNKYDEEKAEAVQNFLFYATDEMHKLGVYLSVDVFGECSSTYVTSYGQYWPAISNIVDVISSMPYTDHFGRQVDTWSNPYKTVYNWAVGAAKRQTEIPTPAIDRTWITAYDTPNWGPTVVYNAGKISDQVKALRDAGLTGGFITWNSASSLAKYEQIKSAFAKDYS